MCKPCYMTVWNREHPDGPSGAGWIKRNPEAVAIYRRRRALKVHGLTPEDYAELWTAQQGHCANPRCSATADLEVPDHRRGLVVDHDHKTGQRRGLLCPPCNLALGCVRDDVDRLLGLIEYLSANR